MTSPVEGRPTTMKRRGLVGRRRLAVLSVWLASALTLVTCAIAFLVCGAQRGRSGLWFFAGGALCAFASVPTIATLLWYVFCQQPPVKSITTNNSRIPTCNVSTVGSFDTFGAQAKSDYPMGPLLIMTLPKKKSNQDLTNDKCPTGLQDSRDSTPDHVIQRAGPNNECRHVHFQSSPPGPGHSNLNSRTQKRNTPPLASEETLSPSLQSASHLSVDSAV